MDALEVELVAKHLPKVVSALGTCGEGWGEGRQEVVAPPARSPPRPDAAAERLQLDIARAVEAPAVEHVHDRDVRLLLHTEVPGSRGGRGACVTRAGERCADLCRAHCGACRSSKRAARLCKVGLSIMV